MDPRLPIVKQHKKLARKLVTKYNRIAVRIKAIHFLKIKKPEQDNQEQLELSLYHPCNFQGMASIESSESLFLFSNYFYC